MSSVSQMTEKEIAQEILATLDELQIYAGLSAHQIKLRNAARQMLAEAQTVHLTSPMFSRAVTLTTGGGQK